MEMSMKMKMIVGMLMMWMVVGEAAVSCGTVVSKLRPCLDYLKSPQGSVPPGCCEGISSLKSLASTVADRQDVCKCLKSAAGSISGIDLNAASGLPAKCHVSIPYSLNPNTDCSKVN